MKEYGSIELNSFTPITMDEAMKFVEVNYKTARAKNPDLPEKPQIIFTAGWYQAIEQEVGQK